jgi:hypothetical protein
MNLPQFIFNNSTLSRMATQWASIINPFLNDPLNNHVILKSVPIVSGSNVINTTLGRKAQGWFVTDISAPVTLYRSAPFNDLTLTLTSSGTATVDVVVF